MPTLRFSFLIDKGVLRPIIPIKLKNLSTGKEFPTTALIDSGADYCAFPAEIAKSLGHNLLKGNKAEAFGIKGEIIDTYLHTNNIVIEDQFGEKEEYKCLSHFSDDIKGIGLLGMDGFFSHFKVFFEYRKGFVILETY